MMIDINAAMYIKDSMYTSAVVLKVSFLCNSIDLMDKNSIIFLSIQLVSFKKKNHLKINLRKACRSYHVK